ncbi:hypothetical protein N802_10775 [Knoellia sinensis KCTC 19936]|uniref:Superoxide dismutase n=1 Tax=Knoellia sinensis KCTC 19936 TaxID=1385520 RepID=A0A0A0J4N9_9MICO|nr:hypothetical protein [Knoellia sinensis]KGN32173.1 hypothetical protein N802_10775 [Knoellia sinensis KCTC 19936]
MVTPARPSRRLILTGAAATVVASTSSLSAPASAGPRRAPRAPETVALPNGLQPEGITSGPGTRFYVGSLAGGRIVAGDLLTGTSNTLLAGATGRSIRGLFWDSRTNLVWAVGSVGAVGHVWAVNGTTGAIVQDTVVPGAGFLNDLVVQGNTVWVTDSPLDRLTAIALTPGGAPTGAAPTFLPLSGDWPAAGGAPFNSNGIRALSDGSLILNNSRVGGLWQVNPMTGHTTEIPVRGGPGIIGGDGLVLDGQWLYNVRGSGPNQVSLLRLSQAGSGWTARWRGARTDETLDVPTTATIAGGWLWAVNARFGVASPGTASYWITRMPAR